MNTNSGQARLTVHIGSLQTHTAPPCAHRSERRSSADEVRVNREGGDSAATKVKKCSAAVAKLEKDMEKVCAQQQLYSIATLGSARRGHERNSNRKLRGNERCRVG